MELYMLYLQEGSNGPGYYIENVTKWPSIGNINKISLTDTNSNIANNMNINEDLCIILGT